MTSSFNSRESRVENKLIEDLIIFDFIKTSFTKNLSLVYKEMKLHEEFFNNTDFKNINALKNKLNIPDLKEIIMSLVDDIEIYNSAISNKLEENPQDEKYEYISEYEVIIRLIGKCLFDLREDLFNKKYNNESLQPIIINQDFLSTINLVFSSRNINSNGDLNNKTFLDTSIISLLDHNLDENYFLKTSFQTLNSWNDLNFRYNHSLSPLLLPSITSQKILNIIHEKKLEYMPSTINSLIKIRNDGEKIFKMYVNLIKDRYPDHATLFFQFSSSTFNYIFETFPSFEKYLPKNDVPSLNSWIKDISQYTMQQQGNIYQHKFKINKSNRIFFSKDKDDQEIKEFLRMLNKENNSSLMENNFDDFDILLNSIMKKLKENDVLFSSEYINNLQYDNKKLEITFSSKDNDIEKSYELINSIFEQIYIYRYIKDLSIKEISDNIKSKEELFKSTHRKTKAFIEKLKNKKI